MAGRMDLAHVGPCRRVARARDERDFASRCAPATTPVNLWRTPRIRDAGAQNATALCLGITASFLSNLHQFMSILISTCLLCG